MATRKTQRARPATPAANPSPDVDPPPVGGATQAPAAIRPATRELPSPRAAARELVTVRDCVRYACTRFESVPVAYGQGTDNAWDEAAWLVLWALHLPPHRLEPFLDASLTAREVRSVVDLIERRCRERIPAAYLTGEAWLRGLRLRSDPRALIPRSLIAEALEESLEDWLGDWDPASILDMCTGGGSLAIAAALRFPQARIDAVDLSEDALALAAENVGMYGLDDRIRLLQGDLFESLGRNRYDLILCNPPYVNARSMSELPPEFLAEPQGALAGGRDGMDLVRRILHKAPAHLTIEGLLLLEIGHEARHFERAFVDLEFAWLPVTAGDNQLVLVSLEQLSRSNAVER